MVQKPASKRMMPTLIWLSVFSVAMGFMESAVVVYLREIYYPGGFGFPLVPISPHIGLTELLREGATITMLYAIARLTAVTVSLRFAYFLLCFAIWDLCYYVFLWLLLDWPESLFTWDILFLIPVPWVGPVLAPCLISLCMILLAGIIIHYHQKGCVTRLQPKEWLLFVSGSLVLIGSFIRDYVRFLARTEDSAATVTERKILFDEMTQYVPDSFSWPLFMAGLILILAGMAVFVKRIRKSVPI